MVPICAKVASELSVAPTAAASSPWPSILGLILRQYSRHRLEWLWRCMVIVAGRLLSPMDGALDEAPNSLLIRIVIWSLLITSTPKWLFVCSYNEYSQLCRRSVCANITYLHRGSPSLIESAININNNMTLAKCRTLCLALVAAHLGWFISNMGSRNLLFWQSISFASKSFTAIYFCLLCSLQLTTITCNQIINWHWEYTCDNALVISFKFHCYILFTIPLDG